MGSKKKKKALKKQLEAQKKQSSNASSKKDPASRKKIIHLGLILLFSFLCYSPNLNNGFVNWDDDRNFTDNELITGLNNENFWANTVEIFQTDVIGGYNPLTIWTFLVEQKLFGQDQPMYWHLNNVLLHLIAVSFLYWIALRMRLGIWGAAILTLLFAIHPMRVESVAWVTERKDVLFGAFYLAAMFYYIKGKQDGFKKKYYLIIGICFLLSLLSKIQAVILPISLILVDYYLSKTATITWKSIINKWPYFIGSLAIGLLGIYFLKDQGSIDQEYTGVSRLFIGSYSLLVYYIKSIVPYEMSPLYPYPASLEWYIYASIVSFPLTAFYMWKAYSNKWKVQFWGISFFLANIILLLQILGAGQGFLADRFTYIPYIGLFFIYAYFIEKAIGIKKYKTPAMALTAIGILAYSFMCFQQNKIWENSETLWTHVLKHYDKTTLPWGNRANYYRDNGMVEKALYDYSQVIRLKPNKPEAYNSRARLYFNYNQRDSLLKALDNYNRAIALKPNDPEYLTNRGATYAKLGDNAKSLENLSMAEKADPDFANIYLNRSIIYNNTQQWQLALNDINKYLELKPLNADMWYEKSRLHMVLGQYEAFIENSNRALSMNPNKGLYHFERARGLFYFSQFDAAKASMRTALNLGYNSDNNFVNQVMNK